MASRRRRTAPVAVVTGAGRRLGKAIAMALHRDGYALVVHYRGSRSGASGLVRTIRREGGEAVSVRADLRTAAGARRVVAAAVDAYGTVDLLVNNAGIFPAADVLTTTERVWDDVLDTNLKGMFFCAQAAARVMRRKGGGVIVNIGSAGGILPWPAHLPYSVSKAGVLMLTRCLARALAPSIRVNAIAPGSIVLRGEDTGVRPMPKRLIPLRRHGNAGDVTELVLFLARRARYVTGQVFAVDGGRTINSTIPR